MKKTMFISLLLALAIAAPSNAQVGKFLKNVKNNVVNEILNDASGKSNTQPEPDCACDNAIVGLDLGKYNLMYSEIRIEMSEDGRMLVTDRMGSSAYIVKDGVATGPVKEGDPRLKDFGMGTDDNEEKESGINPFLLKYPNYISTSGDKYVIKFLGKTYGPYARIDQFVISKAGDKFGAWVTENVTVSEKEGKSMEQRMNAAKTDEEKMALAMEMAQKMQDNVMQAGATGFSPEFISNVPGADLDFGSTVGGSLNTSVKYDEIILLFSDKIMGLTGKTLIRFKNYEGANEKVFVNTDNTLYAYYNYGVITFSDGRTLSETFSPYLTKEGGQVYLAYMYYSPKKNAIMVCKIPF